MIVHGVRITEDQVAAGVASMVGDFYANDVGMALMRAGVTQEGYVCGRAAVRLLQRARKAGKIVVRKGGRGSWRATT